MASEYWKWKFRDVKPEEKHEMTPAQRRRNWWSYHWWMVLGGLIIGAIVVWTVIGIIQRNRYQPDYQVAYIGASLLPDDTAAALQEALAGYGQDCNGDGKVTVQINQYVDLQFQSEAENAYYGMGSQIAILSDLDYCESYFFLLEQPERFQQGYGSLRHLDGALPGEEETAPVEAYALRWGDCPVLAGLELGDYAQETYRGMESGSSQDKLADLYFARRGFWAKRTCKYPEQCDRLWEELTEGAY